MELAARNLQFERAAVLRDRITELKENPMRRVPDDVKSSPESARTRKMKRKHRSSTK